MKNDRIGEHLWHEWDGELYDSEVEDPIVYYTNGFVDIDIDVVKRALASVLQRDGIADSLANGFAMIDKAKSTYGWAGLEENARSLTVCDEDGETCYGDILQEPSEITFIEF
jgi:hypothetical protein